jgi:hypothetical protein
VLGPGVLLPKNFTSKPSCSDGGTAGELYRNAMQESVASCAVNGVRFKTVCSRRARNLLRNLATGLASSAELEELLQELRISRKEKGYGHR